jgi:predicted MFS family arabinose efflux permease
MLNQNMKILLYGANIWYLGEGMLGPLVAVFTERIGGDILDISWALAIYLAVTGLVTIFVGKISDQNRIQEKLMVLGYGLNALFTFGYLFVASTSSLFLIQAGLGIASALATPTWEALYAKHENRKHGGYLWGLAEGEANLITAVAIIMGGLLIKYFSFTALFVSMGCIQVVATIYQARILACKKIS